MSKHVESLLAEFKSLIPHQEKIVTSVSGSSIGWQLDHTLKVINSVCQVIPKSNPEEYKPKTTFSKALVFTTGFIPRGRARAPKVVTADKTSEYELLLQFNQAEESLKVFSSLQPNQFFQHPIFGHLNAKDTQKFLYIHSYHHLKIMRDILKG